MLRRKLWAPAETCQRPKDELADIDRDAVTRFPKTVRTIRFTYPGHQDYPEIRTMTCRACVRRTGHTLLHDVRCANGRDDGFRHTFAVRRG